MSKLLTKRTSQKIFKQEIWNLKIDLDIKLKEN